MEFGHKKFGEIDLCDFTSFFWPGLFLIFWPTVEHNLIFEIEIHQTSSYLQLAMVSPWYS